LQINFFKDHTKIICDPLLGGITYIDEQKRARTFSLELIEKYGCSAGKVLIFKPIFLTSIIEVGFF
jgi:hypothetical protein